MNLTQKQLQNINDAAGLLEMVECLVANFSDKSLAPRRVVPWSGMRLSLSQARELLLDVRDSSSPHSEEDFEPEFQPKQAPRSRAASDIEAESSPEKSAPEKSGAGISSRIQMAPLPRSGGKRGYTRELQADDENKSQENAGEIS